MAAVEWRKWSSLTCTALALPPLRIGSRIFFYLKYQHHEEVGYCIVSIWVFDGNWKLGKIPSKIWRNLFELLAELFHKYVHCTLCTMFIGSKCGSFEKYMVDCKRHTLGLNICAKVCLHQSQKHHRSNKDVDRRHFAISMFRWWKLKIVQ